MVGWERAVSQWLFPSHWHGRCKWWWCQTLKYRTWKQDFPGKVVQEVCRVCGTSRKKWLLVNVLVYLGCYSKIPPTEWLLKEQKFTPHSSGDGSLSSRRQLGQVRGGFQAADHLFHPLLVERAGRLSPSGLFPKGTNPIHGGSSLMTWSPPRGPTSSQITLGIKGSPYGWTKTFRP